MFTLSRRTITALAATFGLSAMLGAGTLSPAGAGNMDIAETLRAGGLVIVVRHGATFGDQADTDPLNFENAPKATVRRQASSVATGQNPKYLPPRKSRSSQYAWSHSALMPAALMIGHHFSISSL